MCTITTYMCIHRAARALSHRGDFYNFRLVLKSSNCTTHRISGFSSRIRLCCGYIEMFWNIPRVLHFKYRHFFQPRLTRGLNCLQKTRKLLKTFVEKIGSFLKNCHANNIAKDNFESPWNWFQASWIFQNFGHVQITKNALEVLSYKQVLRVPVSMRRRGEGYFPFSTLFSLSSSLHSQELDEKLGGKQCFQTLIL